MNNYKPSAIKIDYRVAVHITLECNNCQNASSKVNLDFNLQLF